MRLGERVGYLRAPVRRDRRGHGAPVQHRVQALAPDQFHDQERDLVLPLAVLAQVMDGHDVRVLQAGRDPRLAQEPGTSLTPAAAAAGEHGDHLDGDGPLQCLVLRLPHLPHTALAELAHQPVSTTQKVPLHHRDPRLNAIFGPAAEPLCAARQRRSHPLNI